MHDPSSFTDSIRCLIKNVPSIDEQEILTKLIYEKSSHHRVKCIPPYLDWGMHNDLEIVMDAIIKLGTILLALNKFSINLQSSQSRRVPMYISRIQHDLMEHVIRSGCQHPPSYLLARYNTVGVIVKDYALFLAAEICNTVLK